MTNDVKEKSIQVAYPPDFVDNFFFILNHPNCDGMKRTLEGDAEQPPEKKAKVEQFAWLVGLDGLALQELLASPINILNPFVDKDKLIANTTHPQIHWHRVWFGEAARWSCPDIARRSRRLFHVEMRHSSGSSPISPVAS